MCLTPVRLPILLVVILPALAGCVVGLSSPEPRPPAPVPAPPAPGELRTVLLRVLEAGDSTIAFIPVTIGGQGPFLFALDTGASNTVVDVQVADQVGLVRTGEQREVSGVVGQQTVPLARVEQWQIGDVGLPTTDIALLDLPSPPQGQGLQGLLGSDVLSGFDYVVVDYDDQRLGLPPA
jgi:predicted aspartyl protease